MIRNTQEGHLRAERDFLVAAEGSRWVVPLMASFQDNKHLYLVMEYCIGGDFSGLLICKNTLNEDVTRHYIAEMILWHARILNCWLAVARISNESGSCYSYVAESVWTVECIPFHTTTFQRSTCCGTHLTRSPRSRHARVRSAIHSLRSSSNITAH